MTSNKGFAFILSLAFIPLFTTLVLGMGAVFIGLKNYSRHQSLCIKESLRGYRYLNEQINKLIALNPPAKRTRKAVHLAKKSYKAALATANPALITPARAALAAAKARQAILSGRQKLKYLQIKSALSKSQTQTFTKLKHAGAHPKNLHRPHVDFIIHPHSSPTPNYKRGPFFTTKIRMSYQWNTPIFKTSLFALKNIKNINGRCAVTLRKENNKWNAHLAKVKL